MDTEKPLGRIVMEATVASGILARVFPYPAVAALMPHQPPYGAQLGIT